MDEALASLRAKAMTKRLLPPPIERQRIRRASGVSMSDLASAVGVTAATISHWELGERFPTDKHLSRYQAALEMLREVAEGSLSEPDPEPAPRTPPAPSDLLGELPNPFGDDGLATMLRFALLREFGNIPWSKVCELRAWQVEEIRGLGAKSVARLRQLCPAHPDDDRPAGPPPFLAEHNPRPEYVIEGPIVGCAPGLPDIRSEGVEPAGYDILT